MFQGGTSAGLGDDLAEAYWALDVCAYASRDRCAYTSPCHGMRAGSLIH
jgi:hypothetical protein